MKKICPAQENSPRSWCIAGTPVLPSLLHPRVLGREDEEWICPSAHFPSAWQCQRGPLQRGTFGGYLEDIWGIFGGLSPKILQSLSSRKLQSWGWSTECQNLPAAREGPGPAPVLLLGEHPAPAGSHRDGRTSCATRALLGKAWEQRALSWLSIRQTEVISRNRAQKCNLLSDEVFQIATHLERVTSLAGLHHSMAMNCQQQGQILAEATLEILKRIR